MISALRKAYNQSFTKEKYEAFLNELNGLCPGAIDFRVAETPIYVDKRLKEQMLDTCAYIIQHIQSSAFQQEVVNAIPDGEFFPNQNRIPHCLVFDFGICENEKKEMFPALVELQGFPSLYAFQGVYPAVFEKYFPVPDGYTAFSTD
jgi:hypothetical protein